MVRKRVRWLAGLCAAFVLMLAMCAVGRNFEPLNARAVAEREARRYMLTEFEFIGEGVEGEKLFDCGDEVAKVTANGYICSFFPYCGDAALVPSLELANGPLPIDDRSKKNSLHLFAVDRIEGAAWAELELRLWAEYVGEESREWAYVPERLSYEEGFAVFLLEQQTLGAEEYWAIHNLSYIGTSGRVTNGTGYSATLRYYDAGGEIIYETLCEVGK